LQVRVLSALPKHFEEYDTSMDRPTGRGGTTARPGNPPRPSQRPSPSERAARSARAEVFFRGLVSEMRRVTWPSRQEWISATILTVALVVIIGLYTYTVDELFGLLFGLVHK
jgi:preprotein translocase subunit SecE